MTLDLTVNMMSHASPRPLRTQRLDPHFARALRRRACLGATVALGMGLSLSALSAAVTPKAQSAVHQAQRSAARNASAQAALNALDPDAPPLAPLELSAPPSPEALAAGQLVRAEAPGYSVPRDWQEAGLDLSRAETVDGKLVQTLRSGARVTFTVRPEVQAHLEKLYAQYKIPYGGLVVLEPQSGRVLAMISQTAEGEEDLGEVARAPIAPSASIFKIVTIAALLEGEGISPDKEVCYHGGIRSLTEKNIEGDSKRDTRCGDLSDAMAWSINSLIAKLAYANLSAEELTSWAERFGYNAPIPFELEVAPSQFETVEDAHERARSAAGFWHSTLSPLHGAMISAAVLHGGVMMRPSIIESVHDPDGVLIKSFEPEEFKRVMKQSTASTLKKMMSRTTEVGTARKYFRHRRDFPDDILTGGKTGTLSRKQPSYLGYTWFVGYGEASEDEELDVAVGGLVCNKPLWHIKGPYAASEAIRVTIESLRERAL